MNEQEVSKVLDLALDAGLLLLRSGAEMRRVEEVVVRLSASYGVCITNSVYSVTNGLFASYDDPENRFHLSKTRQVPQEISTRLDQIFMVNQLSRDAEKGRFTLEEAGHKLRSIEKAPGYPFFFRLLAAGIASFAFALLLGGRLMEGIPAFIGGGLSYAFVSVCGKKLSRLVSNLVGGLIFALIALAWVLLFRGTAVSYEKILMGAMMPLIPGLSFTNGFRDFGNGDYLSGTIRLIDALVFFAAAATGAAIVFKIASLVGMNVPEGISAAGSEQLWLHLILAFFSAICFSVMFDLPLKYLIPAGITGLIGWGVYLLTDKAMGLTLATMLSVVTLCFTARMFSSVFKCPLTGFLIPGLIPVVPGSALFFLVFYLINGSIRDAAGRGLQALLICGAIMIGISLVIWIPQKFFDLFGRPVKK